MQKLSSAIIQPTIIAIGASIFLLSYNQNLSVQDYFLHIPFWIGVVRPSGLYWQSTFLKQINKGVFPPEMKVYREMYITSKNAILYDVVLNHTIYHALLTPGLIAYMYGVKMFMDNKKAANSTSSNNKPKDVQSKPKDVQSKPKDMQRNSLGTILKQSLVPLIQGRAIISCASILSEYWITYLSLKKQGSSSTYSLPPNVKRLLMAKEMLLSWSWSGLILKEFFRNYHQNTVE